MSRKAFNQLSCGLYLISSVSGGKAAGCVANTLGQVTSTPQQLVITLNKENKTTQTILESGKFAAAVLSEAATMDLIGKFGFHTSTEVDKFADFKTATDVNGIPYVTEQCTAHFSCTVKQTLDVGTHIMFVGEVDEADLLDESSPSMTYAYYHSVKKGRTPPKASSYQEEEKKSGVTWVCTVCGYVYEGDPLPEDFVCPICGQPASVFERREAAPAPAAEEKKIKAWRCSVCGYIYEGETLPEGYTCPICGQPASVFEPITE